MGQYFENVDLPSKIVEFETKVYGISFKFKTDNGVFSKEKLDFGTRVLLENIPVKELSGEVLLAGKEAEIVFFMIWKEILLRGIIWEE